MAKLKKSSVVNEQLASGKVCQVPGCNEPLTIFSGLGQSRYCRHHQLQMIGNGGLAKEGRSYTFHKKWQCAHCGYDPREDSRFDKMINPEIKKMAQRATLICDHIVKQELAKKLGWDDDKIHGPDNIQTLCQICEKIKSAESGDWHRVDEDDLD